MRAIWPTIFLYTLCYRCDEFSVIAVAQVSQFVLTMGCKGIINSKIWVYPLELLSGLCVMMKWKQNKAITCRDDLTYPDWFFQIVGLQTFCLGEQSMGMKFVFGEM